MMNIKIKNLTTPYIIKSFKNHKNIKYDLLDCIKRSKGNELCVSDNYYSDNISKYDWNENTNFDRPWVKKFQPFLKQELTEIVNILGFNNYHLKLIWFQQYLKNGTHGWHVHSDNYTGVYYLEMSENSAKTQIVNPTNQKDIIELDVVEGDIVLFPSYVIHRAPLNNCDDRKTIISFDINVNEIKQEILEKLK